MNSLNYSQDSNFHFHKKRPKTSIQRDQRLFKYQELKDIKEEISNMREPKFKTQKLSLESGKTYLTKKLKEIK